MAKVLKLIRKTVKNITDGLIVPESVWASAKIKMVPMKQIATPGYQRDKQTSWIKVLRGIFKMGGGFPYLYVNLRADGRYYVIDGLQRYSALQDAGALTAPCIVFEGLDDDTEVKIFLIVNHTKKVSPNAIVKAMPGYAGEFIRGADSSSGVMTNLIGFNGTGRAAGHFPASVIARALHAALTAASNIREAAAEPIQNIMLSLNKELKGNEDVAKKTLAFLAEQGYLGRSITLALAAAFKKNGYKLPKQPVSSITRQDAKKYGHGYDGVIKATEFVSDLWS